MRRSALSATVAVGGDESLIVIAVHLHHVEAHGAVRERQVEAFLAALAPERRTIVLGDFNATRDAPEIAMIRKAGLRDAFESARLAPGAAEQPAGDPGYTFRSDRPDRRIDYIWVTPDLSVRDFRVMPGQASDHRGVAVTVDRAAR
jgi:endonuclease/exonuclease/phosphatase family metal-dependent hydrolase